MTRTDHARKYGENVQFVTGRQSALILGGSCMSDTKMLTDGFELILKELNKVESKLKGQVKNERKRHESKFNKSFGYESIEEAHEDYGFGVITEAKLNKIVDRFENAENFTSQKLVAHNLVKQYIENLQIEKVRIERCNGKGYSKFLK